MSNIITVRDSDIVAAEINTIKEDTRRVMIANAIRIGEKLTEAKSMVPFGEWGKWLEEKVDYSQSTAEDLMKLYREYGGNQESLFDTWTKSETFGNLSYSKHLALLALPFAVRQEFAETHDVENMSTRELQEAIRERDEARNALAEAEQSQQDAVRAQAEAEKRADQLQTELSDAQAAQAAATQQVEKIQKQLDKAKQKEKAAQDALAKAKENPEIPDSVMEQMRKEVEADAAARATEDLQKQLDAALEKAEAATKAKEAAERSAKEAEEKLAAAEKAAKMQNPDVAVFQSLYIQMQKTWNSTVEAYRKVQQVDDTSAANCHKALNAAIQKFQSDIAGEA